jgi:hypothetical protein
MRWQEAMSRISGSFRDVSKSFFQALKELLASSRGWRRQWFPLSLLLFAPQTQYFLSIKPIDPTTVSIFGHRIPNNTDYYIIATTYKKSKLLSHQRLFAHLAFVKRAKTSKLPDISFLCVGA